MEFQRLDLGDVLVGGFFGEDGAVLFGLELLDEHLAALLPARLLVLRPVQLVLAAAQVLAHAVRLLFGLLGRRAQVHQLLLRHVAVRFQN